MSDSRLRFRKIRGHIVPIRMKEPKSVIPGAALIGAGAVAAVSAGSEAYNLIHRAAKVENVARARQATRASAQLSLFKSKGSARLFEAASKLHRARNIALVAGGAIGGALFAAGAKSLIKQNKELKKHPLVNSIATVPGGFSAASTLAAARFYMKLHPVKATKESVKAAFKLARNRKTLQYILKGI